MLFYDEALKLSQRARADRIEDIALGSGGGKQTNEYIKTLRGAADGN